MCNNRLKIPIDADYGVLVLYIHCKGPIVYSMSFWVKVLKLKADALDCKEYKLEILIILNTVSCILKILRSNICHTRLA